MSGFINESDVKSLVADLAAKAPKASPVFTGTPQAPTQSPGDNSVNIATTAYVDAAVAAQAKKTILGSWQTIM